MYELALYGMIEAELCDVDGYAHLGNPFWDMADPDSRKITFASPPQHTLDQPTDTGIAQSLKDGRK